MWVRGGGGCVGGVGGVGDTILTHEQMLMAQ